LLSFSSQAIRKRLRDRGVGVGITPEFMRKRNSELVGIRGRSAADASVPRLAICASLIVRRERPTESAFQGGTQGPGPAAQIVKGRLRL
jgi:hypothetical protein